LTGTYKGPAKEDESAIQGRGKLSIWLALKLYYNCWLRNYEIIALASSALEFRLENIGMYEAALCSNCNRNHNVNLH